MLRLLKHAVVGQEDLHFACCTIDILGKYRGRVIVGLARGVAKPLGSKWTVGTLDMDDMGGKGARQVEQSGCSKACPVVGFGAYRDGAHTVLNWCIHFGSEGNTQLVLLYRCQRGDHWVQTVRCM